MKIKNTDGAFCKIKDIKISGLEAYVTLVLYSSTPQISNIDGNIHRVFSFYLRDKDSSKLVRASLNNYWIDRNNNYNNEASNIDVNMYKEVILKIDIDNYGKGTMRDNKWVRTCSIVLVDTTSSFEEAWESEEIELISKEIELPKIENLKVHGGKDNIIVVDFDLIYNSQEDFNYNNKNITPVVLLVSYNTNKILESLDFPYDSTSTTHQHITFMSEGEYDQPLIASVQLRNTKQDILFERKVFYDKQLSSFNMFIKTQSGIESIQSASIKNPVPTEIKNVSIK